MMLSVIIVNWNTRYFLESCLASVKAQEFADLEIIVVDNGSDDGSREFFKNIKNDFPDSPRQARLKIIENEKNLGFARANNQGLKIAKGEIILFLNADAVLTENAVQTAVEVFSADPRIGAAAPKILRSDGVTIDGAGQFLSRGRKVRDIGAGEFDRGQYDEPRDVFSACAACAFWRKSAIDDISVGGEFFDEDFFSYWEDIDAGWRAQNRGWRIRYEPSSVVYHARGGAFPQERRQFAILGRPPELQWHIFKNRYLTMIKNDEWANIFDDLPFVLGREFLNAVFLLFHPRLAFRLFREMKPLAKRALEKRRKNQ